MSFSFDEVAAHMDPALRKMILTPPEAHEASAKIKGRQVRTDLSNFGGATLSTLEAKANRGPSELPKGPDHDPLDPEPPPPGEHRGGGPSPTMPPPTVRTFDWGFHVEIPHETLNGIVTGANVVQTALGIIGPATGPAAPFIGAVCTFISLAAGVCQGHQHAVDCARRVRAFPGLATRPSGVPPSPVRACGSHALPVGTGALLEETAAYEGGRTLVPGAAAFGTDRPTRLTAA